MLLNIFMNLTPNIAQVLLITYKYHHGETLFIFTIIVFMSRTRSIFVLPM